MFNKGRLIELYVLFSLYILSGVYLSVDPDNKRNKIVVLAYYYIITQGLIAI